MPQSRPVVRELYWPALIPQAIAIAGLCVVAWSLLPTDHRHLAVLVGAAAYLIFCRSMRRLLVHHHTLGMRAYRQGHFQLAILNFDASHRFFSAHPRIDDWRFLLFGVASRNSYRVISLGNMAYCFAQVGERRKAIQLYKDVLRLSPGHAVAKSMLDLLQVSLEST